jgi:hypothetical protein
MPILPSLHRGCPGERSGSEGSDLLKRAMNTPGKRISSGDLNIAWTLGNPYRIQDPLYFIIFLGCKLFGMRQTS